MPTSITHAIPAITVGLGLGKDYLSKRLILTGAFIACVPDLDLISVRFWGIAKDSTYVEFIGPPRITVYHGTSNDYYDFRADGKCYVSRNGTYDTLAYKVVSNGMVFENNGIVNAVDPLTQHNATITFGMGAIGPGAFFNTETLYLKK